MNLPQRVYVCMCVFTEGVCPSVIRRNQGDGQMITAGIQVDMGETNEWLARMRATGRKDTTLATHEGNIRQCLCYLHEAGRPTRAAEITADDIQYLWVVIDAKQETRRFYLRSLSLMVMHHTGVDIVKQANILYNRETRERVFITDTDFKALYSRADPFEKVILSLGAFMGLRRGEMAKIRDCDIMGDRLVVHGKGHGRDGLMMTVQIPAPVMKAIEDYVATKRGQRADDFLLQVRGHTGILHQVLPQTISNVVSDLGKRCGVKVTTHSLRRFCATTLYYQVKCDLTTLRTVMRHADVSTTLRCYVDAYEKKEREAQDALSSHLSALVTN